MLLESGSSSLALLILFLVSITGFWTSEIYISSYEGTDFSGCGNTTKTPCRSLPGAYLYSGKMANAVVEIFLNCTGSYPVIKNYPLKFLSNQSISLKSYSCFGDFHRAEISGDWDDPFLFSIYGDLGSPSIKIERVSIRGPRIVAFFQNETFTSSTSVTTPASPRDDGRISKIHILHCIVSQDDWSRSTKSPILIQPSLADGYVPHFEIFIDDLIIIRGGGYQLISVPPSSINLTLSILDSQIWNTLFKLDVAAGSFSLEHTKFKNSENDEYDIEGHNLFELNNFDNVTIFAVSFDSRPYIKGLLWISNCSNVEMNGLEVNKPLYDWDNSSLSNKNNNNNNNNNNARTVIRSSGNTHRKSIVAITNSGSISLKNCRYKQSYNGLQLYHNRILEISNTTINNLDIQNAINLTISNTYIKTGTPITMSNIAETVIIKTCGFTDIGSSYVETIHLESGKNVIIDNSTFDTCSSFYAGTFYFGRGVLNVTITNTVVTSPKKKTPNSYTILKSEAKRLYLENVTMTVFNTIAQNDLYSSVPLQFWNFTFICPNSSNPVESEDNSYLACAYCRKGEYNLQNGYYKSDDHILNIHRIKCLPCPLGGVCDKTITSKANFWGFVNEDKQIVSFIPCPAQYCCNGQENPCVGLDTCAPNRTGNICGQCQSDHYIDLFSPQCIPAKHCLDEDSNLDMRVFTVLIFCGAVFLYVFVICLSVNFLQFFSGYCCGGSNSDDAAAASNTAVLVESDHQERDDERTYLLRDPNSDQENRNSRSSSEDSSQQSTRIVNRATNDKDSGMAVGIFKILINFYQINSLIRIADISSSASPTTNGTSIRILKSIIDSLFNLKVEMVNAMSSFCFKTNLEITEKLLIRDFLFSSLAIIVTILLIGCSTETVNRPHHPRETATQLTPKTRYKIAVIQMILIGFSNMATFALQMTNCVTINSNSYLYIGGNVKCSESIFYNVSLSYLVLVSAPFSMSLYLATRMLEYKWIDANGFIMCLLFPPFALMFYAERKWKRKWTWGEIADTDEDENGAMVAYEETKWILSVLTGPFRENTKHSVILWDHVLITRRFMISVIVTFAINPLVRSCILAPFLLAFLIHHQSVLVYKSWILNCIESFYLACLCFLCGGNTVRAFVYVYNLMFNQKPLSNILEFFEIFEDVLLTLPVFVLVLFLLGKLLYAVVQNLLGLTRTRLVVS